MQTFVMMFKSELNICQPERTIADAIVSFPQNLHSHQLTIDLGAETHEHNLYSSFEYNVSVKLLIQDSEARHHPCA